MEEGWIFTKNGIATAITEVSCDLFIITPSPCEICTSNQVNLINSTIIPSATGPTADSETGCLTLVVTCKVGELGEVFMQFNGGIGGPESSTDEVSATLNCVDGEWQFTQDGVTTNITSVECIG